MNYVHIIIPAMFFKIHRKKMLTVVSLGFAFLINSFFFKHNCFFQTSYNNHVIIFLKKEKYYRNFKNYSVNLSVHEKVLFKISSGYPTKILPYKLKSAWGRDKNVLTFTATKSLNCHGGPLVLVTGKGQGDTCRGCNDFSAWSWPGKIMDFHTFVLWSL